MDGMKMMVRIDPVCGYVETWQRIDEMLVVQSEYIPLLLGHSVERFVAMNGGKVKGSMDVRVWMG